MTKRQLSLEFEHKKELSKIKSCQNKINNLQAKLREKQKEIEELRFKSRNIFPLVENLEEKINQDKISFAVERLEKVRTQFQTKYSWYEERHRVCEKTDDFIIWLDKQIEEIKKDY